MQNINKISSSTLLLGFGIFTLTFYDGPGSDYYQLSIVWLLLFISTWRLQSSKDEGTLKLPYNNTARLMMGIILFLITIYFFSQSKYHSFPTTFGLLFLPFYYLNWKLVKQFRDNSLWPTMWKILLFTGLFTASWAIVFDITTGNHYINGQRYDPNTFAEILLVILIPGIMQYLMSDKTKSINSYFLLIAIYIMTTAMLFSDSRAVFLIAPTLIFFMILYLVKIKQLNNKRLILLVITLILSWLTTTTNQPDIYSFEDVQSISGTSIQVRLQMWESTLMMYQQHPWIGSGLGTFSSIYPSYRHQDEIFTLGLHAHNDYLQLLVEGGPLLLLLFIMPAVINLYYAYRIFFNKYTDNQDYRITTLHFSLCMAITGLYVHALVNFVLIVPVFLAILGIYLAEVSTTFIKSTPIKTITLFRNPRSLKVMLLTFMCLPYSLLLLGTFSNTLFNPASSLGHANKLSEKISSGSLYQLATVTTIVRPDDLVTRYHLTKQLIAALELSKGDVKNYIYSQIIFEYQKIIASCPICPAPYAKLAEFYENQKEWGKAEQYYKKAIDRNPGLVDTYISLATVLAENGKYDEAYSLLVLDVKNWVHVKNTKKGIINTTKLNNAAIALSTKYGH